MGQNLRPHRSIERTKAIDFPRLSTSRDRQIMPNLQRCQRSCRLGVIRRSARSPSRNVHEYSVGASPNANLTLLLGRVSGSSCTAAILSRSCPLWVKSGHWGTSERCPLYPQKRTWISTAVMSALCQKQTLCGAAFEFDLFAVPILRLLADAPDQAVASALARMVLGRRDG